jgi:hypothetical protein
MQLVNDALIGRLLRSALDLGVDVRVSSPVAELVREPRGRPGGDRARVQRQRPPRRRPAVRPRGTPFNRYGGDPTVRPNPSLTPIEKGPFYAVRIVPGSFGTFARLATDEHARVLDGDDAPIPGLYAVGNDQASVMGGHYPAGGINIGPATTFGFIAARDLAETGDRALVTHAKSPARAPTPIPAAPLS